MSLPHQHLASEDLRVRIDGDAVYEALETLREEEAARRAEEARRLARAEEKARRQAEKKRKKGKKRKKPARPPRIPRYTARTADRHELYQRSVQAPEEDVKFYLEVYDALRGGRPRHLREDFCGTAYLMSHWVRVDPSFTCEGYDIDAATLAWGVEHNFLPLGEAARRALLRHQDVREPSAEPPDIRVATNFSWQVFKTRRELLGYFRSVYEDLPAGALFVLDIHGGPEAMQEQEEITEHDDFDYVWDQDVYWPATGEYTCHIHFRFPDGTALERAFTYEWRLWGLPEVLDVLRDAGFEKLETWWEGTDEDGESGNGIFTPDEKGENCLSWITYIVAQKRG